MFDVINDDVRVSDRSCNLYRNKNRIIAIFFYSNSSIPNHYDTEIEPNRLTKKKFVYLFLPTLRYALLLAYNLVEPYTNQLFNYKHCNFNAI